LPDLIFSKEDTSPFSVGAVLLCENKSPFFCLPLLSPLLSGHQTFTDGERVKDEKESSVLKTNLPLSMNVAYLREIVSTGRFGLYILIIMISEVNVLVGSIYWNGRNKIQLPEYDLKRTSSGTHPWTVGDV